MNNLNNIEVLSADSSIEIHDAVINESWDWGKVQRKSKKQKSTTLNIPVELSETSQETLLGRVWRFINERAINSRLAKFDEEEQRNLVKQRLTKITGILMDENTRRLLSGAMMCSKTGTLLQEPHDVLKRKYGSRMAEWLLQKAQLEDLSSHSSLAKRRRASKKATDLEMALAAEVDESLGRLRANDPLTNWFKQKSDVSGRMLARIQNLAAAISGRVCWSFLIDPGRPRTDLSKFFAEFDVLENFFDKVELSPEETSQKAFEANGQFKTRNKKMSCVDWSRVKLTVPTELTQPGVTKEAMVATKQRPQPADIFGDLDCPTISTRTEFGHGDFINASYVVGGPLLNAFILTQAPLRQTIPDFWRMVWQEKSEYIFMLCDAVEPESLGGLFNANLPNYCPYYWPRYEGEVSRFGRLRVKNVKLDSTTDPLFNVTHLALWLEDEPEYVLRVQHWQWDWRDYSDFNWPFRLLIRARHSKRPTIIHCLDGCGRSGTLALIEVFLMQLLRGAVSYDNPMLTSAIFLRLQRRHCVANRLQYMYAYRTILHWVQPFVISLYHRLILGFVFTGSGFAGKYEQIAARRNC